MKKNVGFFTVVLTLSVFFISSLQSSEKNTGDEVVEMRNILQQARQAATVIADEFGKDLIMEVIFKAQLKAGDVEGALKTAAAFRVGPDARTFLEIAVAQVKAGDRASASETFRQALRAAIADGMAFGYGGAEPADLRDIAEAQVEVGDLTGALETAATVNDNPGMVWPVVWLKGSVLHAIADTQAKMGNIQGALSTAAMIQDNIWKAYALKDVAVVQAEAGHIKEALRTAATIRRDSFKAKALKEIAIAQAKARDRASAARTFQQALRTVAMLRDESLREDVFGIEIYFPSGSNTRSEDPLKAEVFENIAIAQAKAGDIKGALKTAATIKDRGVIADSLYKIAVIQVEAGDIQGALRTAAAIKRDPPKSWVLRIIAIAQAKARDIKGALQTAASIQNDIYEASDFYKVSALAEIAVAQVKAGDRAATTTTFPEARRIAASIQDNDSKIRALRDLAVAQAVVGDVKAALETAAMIRSEVYMGSALYDIAVSRVRAGDIQAAFQVAANMQYAGYKDSTLKEIAVAQAKMRDVRSALQTAGTIRETRTQAYALQGIAAAQANTGNVKGALSWSSNLESPLQKCQALLGVAEGILARRDAEKPHTAPR